MELYFFCKIAKYRHFLTFPLSKFDFFCRKSIFRQKSFFFCKNLYYTIYKQGGESNGKFKNDFQRMCKAGKT